MTVTTDVSAKADSGCNLLALADGITWTIPGTNSLSGTYTGWDAVVGLFVALYEKSGGTLNNELIDVIANDRNAYAIMDTTATIGGETKT